MKKLIFAAITAVSLTGCASYGGYGSGLSIGVSSGFGFGGGYGGGLRYGYGAYGYDNDCIRYDRHGRPYYTCNSYYGPNGFSQAGIAYYYPGYTYRQGYYYDRQDRRYEGAVLYREHYLHNQYRRRDHR